MNYGALGPKDSTPKTGGGMAGESDGGTGAGAGASMAGPSPAGPDGGGAGKGPATDPTGSTSTAGGVQSWQQQIQEFIKHLTGPLDMNDPGVASIVNGAYNQASSDAANRGIQGPASITGAQQAYANSGANLMMQRQGLAGQMMGAGGNLALGQQNLNQNEQQIQYQMALNNYLSQMQRSQGMGSAIGTMVGGMIPFIGAQAGGQIGAGFGGMGMQPFNYPTSGMASPSSGGNTL